MMSNKGDDMSNEKPTKKTYVKPEMAEMGYLNRFVNQMFKVTPVDGGKFYFPSKPGSFSLEVVS